MGERFDYLGYTHRNFGETITSLPLSLVLTEPKLGKLKDVKAKVKSVILRSKNLSATELVNRLNPIIRR